MEKLDSLIATAHKLRSPGGCPWDAEQTHGSLVQYLLEETYELIEAIENRDRDEILEELGDVLYQVIFHSDLASTGSLGKAFDIEDVAAKMEAKMRHRHPHVFGDEEAKAKFAASTGEDVMQNWDAHKSVEKPSRSSILDGVPGAMPALALSRKVIGKIAKDPRFAEKVPDPIHDTGQIPTSETEFGKLLLRLVVSARAFDIDPERALRVATRQLMDEVRHLESAGETEDRETESSKGADN